MLTPCCWPRRRDFTQSDSDLAELARLMRLKAVDRDTHHTWAKHLWALLAAPPIASVGEEQEVAIGLQRDTEIHSEKNLVLKPRHVRKNGALEAQQAGRLYV